MCSTLNFLKYKQWIDVSRHNTQNNVDFVGKWMCCWHHCDECGRNATKLCSQCPNSYCNQHLKGKIFRLDSGHFVCEDHTEMLRLTEHTQVDSSTPMRDDIYSVHSDQSSDDGTIDNMSQHSDTASIASSLPSVSSSKSSKSSKSKADAAKAMSVASSKSKNVESGKQRLLTDFISPEKRDLPKMTNVLKQNFSPKHSKVSKENIVSAAAKNAAKAGQAAKKNSQKLTNGATPNKKSKGKGSKTGESGNYEDCLELIIDM